MHACTCTRKHTHTRSRMHMRMQTHNAHVNTHTHTHTHTHTRSCMHICVYSTDTHTQSCMSARAVRTCVCVCIHIVRLCFVFRCAILPRKPQLYITPPMFLHSSPLKSDSRQPRIRTRIVRMATVPREFGNSKLEW